MKIQHKRSAVAIGGQAKEPTAAQTERGELCINFSREDPALFIKDVDENIIRVGGDLSLYQKIEDVPSATVVCSPSEIDTLSPPDTRGEGSLWWNTEDGILYVWYEDADSSQWVITVPQGGGAGGDVPPGTTVGTAPPLNPQVGQLWWNSDDNANGDKGGGRLYVYYNDGDSAQWVDTSVPGGKGSYLNESEAKGMFLSSTEDDTAAGEITFQGKTTHESGAGVTGGFRVDGNSQLFSAESNTLRNKFNGTTLLTQDVFVTSSGFTTAATNTNDAICYTTIQTVPQNTSGKFVGYHSAINTSHNVGSGTAYNFYAAGDAPNYFAGLTEHVGGVKVTGGTADTTAVSLDISSIRNHTDTTDIPDQTGAEPLNAYGSYASVVSVRKLVNSNTTGTDGKDFDGIHCRARILDSSNATTFNGFKSTLDTLGANDFTNEVNGFSATNSLVTGCAGTAIGYKSNLAISAGRNIYNFYAAGTAPSFFAGKLLVSEGAKNSVQNDAATNSGIFTTTSVSTNSTGAIRILSLNQGSSTKRVYQTFSTCDNNTGAGAAVISRIQSTGTAGIRILNIDGTDPMAVSTTASTVTNPQDISFDASALVKLLQPKTFEIGGASKVGFLAEDLKVAAPMTTEDEEEGTSYSPSSLIPILTKALQEVIAKNEDLEARLAALEGA